MLSGYDSDPFRSLDCCTLKKRDSFLVLVIWYVVLFRQDRTDRPIGASATPMVDLATLRINTTFDVRTWSPCALIVIAQPTRPFLSGAGIAVRSANDTRAWALGRAWLFGTQHAVTPGLPSWLRGTWRGVTHDLLSRWRAGAANVRNIRRHTPSRRCVFR